jgi:hypothetical protein
MGYTENRYRSKFKENAIKFHSAFNKASELKSRIKEIMDYATDSDVKSALEVYQNYYVQTQIDAERGDKTGLDTMEYKVFDRMFTVGDISLVKSQVKNAPAKLYDQAEKAYNFIVSYYVEESEETDDRGKIEKLRRDVRRNYVIN